MFDDITQRQGMPDVPVAWVLRHISPYLNAAEIQLATR
jgi:hypothetical protein